MHEYEHRFARMNRAVEAHDWGMAVYQLDKAIEIQKVGETMRPDMAGMLSRFEQSYLAPLNTAIKAKDKVAFDIAYNQAINGCNACHQANGRPIGRTRSRARSRSGYPRQRPCVGSGCGR